MEKLFGTIRRLITSYVNIVEGLNIAAICYAKISKTPNTDPIELIIILYSTIC